MASKQSAPFFGYNAIIVTAGLAEITAGAISMGLGGYLAGRTDVDHYHSERIREADEVESMPKAERLEVQNIFEEYGLSDEQINPIVDAIASDKNRWIDFMMRFELDLEEPNPRHARTSALTIAASYIVGGLGPAQK
ncbi:MAG: VIT1/CCC1 transporter family protein [Aggregatilineales bacterium]